MMQKYKNKVLVVGPD